MANVGGGQEVRAGVVPSSALPLSCPSGARQVGIRGPGRLGACSSLYSGHTISCRWWPKAAPWLASAHLPHCELEPAFPTLAQCRA